MLEVEGLRPDGELGVRHEDVVALGGLGETMDGVMHGFAFLAARLLERRAPDEEANRAVSEYELSSTLVRAAE